MHHTSETKGVLLPELAIGEEASQMRPIIRPIKDVLNIPLIVALPESKFLSFVWVATLC